jgi:two-component system phosphate regulon sensor histidine kinase PhoR
MLLDGEYGLLPEEQKLVLNKIYKVNENLESLASEFLDASKLEAGKLEISPKIVPLSDLEKEMKELVERLKPLAEDKKIVVNFSSSLNFKLSAQVDLKRLTQAAESLLENSLNYTPEGGRVDFLLENDDYNIETKIADNGIGIPEKEQKELFTKFFRATNARKLLSSGSGLGLYLCKK